MTPAFAPRQPLPPGTTPDIGRLIDLSDNWIGQGAALRQTILVENPNSLFGFADIAGAT